MNIKHAAYSYDTLSFAKSLLTSYSTITAYKLSCIYSIQLHVGIRQVCLIWLWIWKKKYMKNKPSEY